MPISDKNWRAKPELPSIDNNRPTINSDANHPSSLRDANSKHRFGSPTPFNNNASSSPGSYEPMRRNRNAIGMHGSGMFTSPIPYANIGLQRELDNLVIHRIVTYSPSFRNPTNLGGSTENLNNNGSSINAENGSSVFDAAAAHHDDVTDRLRGKFRKFEQARARKGKAPISTPPGLQRPAWHNQCIRNGNGEGNSKIHNANAGVPNGNTNTMGSQRISGYFDYPGTPNAESHRPSNKERFGVDDIAYKTRMTVVYGDRILALGETVQTEKQVIRAFLAPFEGTKCGCSSKCGCSFAKRILVKWPRSKIMEMAQVVTDSARSFSSQEEHRQPITLGRVLTLRDFLVKSGLCVEPRIGNTFIAEGCRMLASFDSGKGNYRTEEKLMSCFTLMLKTVIFKHPRNTMEWAPIWNTDISIAGSDFTSRGKHLPGGIGVSIDENNVELPSGAVFMDRKYCTPDGCITCGIVHPPSYFEKAYPKLAKAIMEKEKLDYKAKKPEMQRKLSAQRKKYSPMSLRLAGSLYTRRLLSNDGVQLNSGRVSLMSSYPRPSTPIQTPKPYRCSCLKVFDNSTELENCKNTAHGIYRY